MSSLLDQLRTAGADLLEHELPSLDEMRKIVGAIVKVAEEQLSDEEIAKIGDTLAASAAAPTNDGGVVGDANGGAPANVIQQMPTAAEIAAALIAAGAVPGIQATAPTPAIAEPATPPTVTADPVDVAGPSHVADPQEFVPSPLPEPKAAPVIATSDAPVPAPDSDEALRQALADRGLSAEQIDAALSGGVEPAPPVDTTPEG